MAIRIADIGQAYLCTRYAAFAYRYRAGVGSKLALALGMAGLTGLAAQVRIPLPWSPVPITGQTFAVLLAGVLLGRRWGGASLALYAGLGAAGMPWFNGGSGGMGMIMGPTGGYIVGFILAALFLGHFVDTYARSRDFLPMLSLMLFATFVLIHGPGLLGLNLWFSYCKGEAPTLSRLLWMGTIPFVPGDITKAVVAAALTKGITPKEPYGGE